jgi:hypothetical protein
MPDGQQNPCGAGAVGAGCVTRVFAVPVAVGAAAENAAVERADAKKKMPARAIDLSMGFSCVLVVADDAGPPRCDDSAPSTSGGCIQRTREKPRLLAGISWGSCISSRTSIAAWITMKSSGDSG